MVGEGSHHLESGGRRAGPRASHRRDHVTTPKANIPPGLERNFVERDDDPGSAADPNSRRLILDNSGHGTGTLAIPAGRTAPALEGTVLGGAPDAEVVPLRVADSVVLLRTSALARALRYAHDHGCDVVTLSMGGLPSRAWAEAVDDVYEGGRVHLRGGGQPRGLDAAA